MKNRYKVCGDVVKIFIYRRDGEEITTSISREDLLRVNRLTGTFGATKTKSGYYIKTSKQVKGVYTEIQLHRFILNAQKDEWVDHIDGDTLNNTRENLRIVTPSQNAQNSVGKNAKSGFKGVYWNQKLGRWYGQVVKNYKKYSTGYYADKYECKKAVDQLREELHPYATQRAF